jgi:hypothetical protein
MWPYANSKCTFHDIPWEDEAKYTIIACSSIVFDTFHAFHAHFLQGTILKLNELERKKIIKILSFLLELINILLLYYHTSFYDN